VSSSNWELRLESSEIVGLGMGFSMGLGVGLLMTMTSVSSVSGSRAGLVGAEGVSFVG
jgi:hypothetical protein